VVTTTGSDSAYRDRLAYARIAGPGRDGPVRVSVKASKPRVNFSPRDAVALFNRTATVETERFKGKTFNPKDDGTNSLTDRTVDDACEADALRLDR